MATHTVQVPAAKSATAAKVLVSWSGGKDSALALAAIRRSGEYEPAALLTTVTEGYDRISMHGVRRVLLERQAEALGLPLEVVTAKKNWRRRTCVRFFLCGGATRANCLPSSSPQVSGQ
jgi:PP-loop superfamily ATP-utilizing enzyme